MLRQIPQVLRLIQLMAEQKKGGLLLMLWSDTTTPAQIINCTVAAAGPWCAHIEMKAFHYVLTDLKVSLFSSFSSCPDPEELRAFTELYGPLKFKLSFQINIHLTVKVDQHTVQYAFGAKVKKKLKLFSPVPLKLDVTCNTQPAIYGKERCWCLGGHPVCGSRLHVSIPPHAMDQGLFGDLSIQFVTLLSPCVLQYPNLATHISNIQLMVFNPSRVPVLKVPRFFQTLPAFLDFEDLGVDTLHCSSKDVQQLCGTSTYTSEPPSCSGPQQETSAVWQRVLVFLFLQLTDPFTSQLTDVMATEVLIERHLEDILNNNRHAMTVALQSELRNTLKAHNCRKKIKEKLNSAAEVILSSSISIVSCSSNLDFRRDCLNRMKVRDTQELSAAFGESLRRVTSWKCVPRHSCYSAKMKEHSECDDLIRAEM
ncbi:type 2 DNA topoisomerase 6 subunit B-like isoform X2 [Gouania willdenowi]|uniref:type 2 DNA topoisomerase 6 subunit B-like isoform X2 n=1 Tax=Gouania willdenowi TaxID=441366 RepID=UPI0010558B5D|nr:type 2 DNA topoisomerase 6 subunit B-like isoform X2 [Gouania willdenowi]